MLIDNATFASLLSADISSSNAKMVGSDHPTMTKITKIQVDLAVSHVSGGYVEIDEADLREIIAFTSACRKASGVDLTPHTLTECFEMLRERVMTPDTTEALRPFCQERMLRDELQQAQDKMVDALFAGAQQTTEREPDITYPTLVAWDYDHAILETASGEFHLTDWRRATDMIRKQTVQYAWA